MPRRRAAGPVGGFADAAENIVDRQHRRDLGARQHIGEVGGDERHLGIDFGVGGIVGRRRAGCSLGGLHAQRIEGGNVGGQFRCRKREIAGDAHERADAHDLAVADTAGLGVANDPALGGRLADRRQAVGLAGGGGPVAGAAQRELHAFGHGGEIALAVQRRENGAAHQGRAAQAGQDRPAEPLHRYATAIDKIAGFTVNGQRRFMAEVDMIGLATRPVCAAPFAVIQNRPLHSHQRVACHKPRRRVPKTRPTAGLCPEPRQRCRGSSGPSTDRALSSSLCREAPSRCACAADAESPELTPPADQSRFEECGPSATSGAAVGAPPDAQDCRQSAAVFPRSSVPGIPVSRLQNCRPRCTAKMRELSGLRC